MSGYLNLTTSGGSDDGGGLNSVAVSDDEVPGRTGSEELTSQGQDVAELDGDGDDAEVHVPVKRKSDSKLSSKTLPAVKQESKFSEVAKAQEDTVQKSIDLKVKRLEATKDTDIARIKAQERILVEKEKLRTDLKLQKMKPQQERLRLASFRKNWSCQGCS